MIIFLFLGLFSEEPLQKFFFKNGYQVYISICTLMLKYFFLIFRMWPMNIDEWKYEIKNKEKIC